MDSHKKKKITKLKEASNTEDKGQKWTHNMKKKKKKALWWNIQRKYKTSNKNRIF